MRATELLQQARSVGLKVAVHGEKLEVRGPQDVLESPLIEELRKHKAELLEALENNGRQEWDFRIIHVGQDPWIVGARVDKPGQWVFWFIREARKQ